MRYLNHFIQESFGRTSSDYYFFIYLFLEKNTDFEAKRSVIFNSCYEEEYLKIVNVGYFSFPQSYSFFVFLIGWTLWLYGMKRFIWIISASDALVWVCLSPIKPKISGNFAFAPWDVLLYNFLAHVDKINLHSFNSNQNRYLYEKKFLVGVGIFSEKSRIYFHSGK